MLAMLSMYVTETIKTLEGILESARSLQNKFERGNDVADLLVDAQSLSDRLRSVLDHLPNEDLGGSCSRHLGWMVRRLSEGKPDLARSDIDDLVRTDIPGVIESLSKWARDADYLDHELRAALVPLVRTNQLDSAIRKAFVLLTDRLRTTYDLPASADGEDLVNRVFGKDSSLHVELDNSQRLAYRNLFAGLYGVIRNRYSHNNHAATIAEAQAAIAMINMCLQVLDELNEPK